MKKIVLIYCHPYNQSFNHAVFVQLLHNLTRQHITTDVIDLYADHFNPVYDLEELRLFHDGKTHDPLVTKYLNLLKSADGIIFVTPIWWNELPSMLKGFIDKVMKEGEGLSHTVTKTGIRGELTNLKRAYVFTTSASPTFYLQLCCGNAIKKIFIKVTLKQLGIKSGIWYNLGGISNAPAAKRQAYLKKCGEMTFDFS
ncbi:NAD(P)H-dependent oxidoreductase [Lentilactobacillus farraginis]|uniref:NAD(P)H dehydrogenase n=1 Tax=Lentilactobacillus farraginis DSM 18382 = JCM 14108 TaxID=1423743 RepID=X0PB16_9LACO|nr:NAD(P)H-dependent oxidoreductase [Lentilactobacillus farraginis]GAF37009.1 NAD(P)H dehydrogenase [Lentilactobacillus farraginis DSM 18382 = JCM 14108]